MVMALTTFNLKIGTIFIYKCKKEIAQRLGLCNTKLCSHEEIVQHGRVFRRKDQIRKTTLASPQMVADKLKNRRLSRRSTVYSKKLEMMLEDLHTNGKEEYMSAVGLVMLFKRSRGQLTGG